MNTDTPSAAAIPSPALWLGLGGLLPFLVSAAAMFVSDSEVSSLALSSLGGYGAVILSFLGGVKWGVVVNDRAAVEHWHALLLSVVPSLVAWPALLLPPAGMLAVLITGFALQYVADRASVAAGELPEWYGRLRLILTMGAIVALLLGWFALVNG